MHYELFLTSTQRSVRNGVIHDINNHDNYKNALAAWYSNNQLFNDPNVEGFKTIDRLLDWCEDNGLYVILDLHAAPGGQGADRNIADIFWPNNLDRKSTRLNSSHVKISYAVFCLKKKKKKAKKITGR